jgi:hypothetical protein
MTPFALNLYKCGVFRGALSWVPACAGTTNSRFFEVPKRLDRFTLRGQKKVDGQWKLYCLVHNIEKLAHHGYAG